MAKVFINNQMLHNVKDVEINLQQTPIDNRALVMIPEYRVDIKTEGNAPMISAPEVKYIQHDVDNKAVIVYWADGTRTAVHAEKNQEDLGVYYGFVTALAQKIYGSNSAVKKIVEDKDMFVLNAEKEKEKLARITEQKNAEERNHRRKVKAVLKQMKLEDEAMHEWGKEQEKLEDTFAAHYGEEFDGE